MITLPPKDNGIGLETRLLLSECQSPSYTGTYTLSEASTCMALMDLVLWNRTKNPKPFLASKPTLLSVITAPNQFDGFSGYPKYSSDIVARIQSYIDIANSKYDKRSQTFADFINLAIQVATNPTISDPSPGSLVAWKTKKANPLDQILFFTSKF